MRKAVLLTGIVLSSACSGLAGDGYNGEPLAKIVGEITTATKPTSNVAAALIWLRPQLLPTPQGPWLDPHTASMATIVPVEGNFPASFSITLYEPPPEAVMWDSESVMAEGETPPFRAAGGQVVAVDPDRVIDNGDGTLNVRDALLGSTDVLDENDQGQKSRIFYLDRDVPLLDVFNEERTWKKGYHMQQVEVRLERACDEQTIRECVDTFSPPEFIPAGTAVPPLDVVEAYCSEPHEFPVHDWLDVSMETRLSIHLQPGPVAIPTELDGGIYPASSLPTCPASE